MMYLVVDRGTIDKGHGDVVNEDSHVISFKHLVSFHGSLFVNFKRILEPRATARIDLDSQIGLSARGWCCGSGRGCFRDLFDSRDA